MVFSVAALGLSVLVTNPAQAATDPGPFVAPPPASTTVQISQVSTQGPGGTLDEFVEIQNVQAAPLDISGYSIWACTATNQQVLLATIPSGVLLNGSTADPNVETGRYYLLANEAGYSRNTPPDQVYSGDIQRTGGVMLRGAPTAAQPLGARIDMIGFSVGNACTESSPAVPQTGFTDASNVRHGNVDTNVNAFDFTLVSPSFPRNSSF
jgi:hypothetical protein